MILCNDKCIPCCDYCVHVIQHMGEINGKIVGLGPIGCKLHEDSEHQNLARGCSYCDDFKCMNCGGLNDRERYHY